MHREHLRPVLSKHFLHRQGATSTTEEQLELRAHRRDIVALQRLVGNKGVQSLLTQGRISQRGSAINLARTQAAHSIQRCSCGGTCAACHGEHEAEIAVVESAGSEVQRWWDDEEESSGDDGGSWFDDAVDTVSSWVSDEPGSEYGGSSSGDGHSNPDGSIANPDGSTTTPDGSVSGPDGEPVEDDGGGSWFDDASDWASDAWDDFWGEDSDEEEDDDWLPDWLPDIEIPSWGDEDTEEPLDIGDIEVTVEGEGGQGTCMSEEAGGQGSGSSGGVSAAGLTTIDWSASTGTGSFKNPSIKKRTEGSKTVYDVSGKVHIDYSAPQPNVSFTIKPPLSQLSACKQEKVNAFTSSSGDLGKHEAEHVAKLKSFDGSEEFDHTFVGLEATDTNDLTAKVNAALNALVQPKITARQTAAQTASNNLDPWSKTIPGIESCTS
jgi:hypothetical protein